MSKKTCIVREATWQADGEALRSIRQQVFVEEQKVSPKLEWDGLDLTCRHALALDNKGEPVGCARLLHDGRLGRMAVIPSWRGCGTGTALLNFMIDIVRARGQTECRIDAQVSALSFYRRRGFKAYGDEFLDADIPHKHMRLIL